MTGNSKVCIEIQSELILPNSINIFVTFSLQTLTNELKETMH